MLEFRILGPFEVVEGQKPVLLGGPRQRALLAILLLRRGEVLSSDRLIDQLWGDRPPATAAKTLQGYVSHLRKIGSGCCAVRGGSLDQGVHSGERPDRAPSRKEGVNQHRCASSECGLEQPVVRTNAQPGDGAKALDDLVLG